ncbi:heterokaryon incompatibility protein-domain-containing protein [Cercophora newfieldiana]|uniref:Heterokaryon incompatibility protein-domain-containing protein n=1 Tax=Cercophora newfieldiana TaxID=92897 RepID=A0AA40CVQ7_9PEZI|nr:heterokaryon incompatibility protein-domain-containing protein [Cercophora newfieldiana]
MDFYPYLTLRPEIHEIRLLSIDIDSAPSDDAPQSQSQDFLPWSLKLIHASLDSQPPPHFAALSYVWGDPSGKRQIEIDGHPIAVTKNLHSALTRLHRQRFTGCIWIDALCINQSDTLEKNLQVPLMARIYSQAEQVLVWLGPEPDSGALRVVQQLGVLFREQVRNFPGEGRSRIPGFVQTVRDYSITATSPPAQSGFDFEAIWRFFRQRAWWRRVWIIQEVVLARQAVMLCTEDPEVSAPWEDVRECLQVFERMILSPSTAPEYRRLYDILGEVYPNVMHLAVASDGYKRCQTESGVSDGLGQAGMPLMEVITWTSFGTGSDDSIQATDPRDRVYGLLGITRLEDRQRILVDYSPSTTLNKVLFMVAKVLLEQNGPDVLCFCRETELSLQGLPSWVPDFTARRIPMIGDVSLGDNGYEPYDACKGTVWPEWGSRSHIVGSVYEEPVVSLPGLIVGRIAEVGQEFKAPPSTPSFLNDCRDWLQELKSMVEKSTAYDAPREDEDVNRRQTTKSEVLENLWRVPIADLSLVKRPGAGDTPLFIEGFAILTGQQPPPEELDEEAKFNWVFSKSWDYRVPWKIYERRAFVDGDGRPGLGPKNLEPDDSIVVFAGGHVPFILRRKEGDSLYSLVGSAYVYGLMDGEAVGGDPYFDDIMLG